jgi:hypothetical protein
MKRYVALVLSTTAFVLLVHCMIVLALPAPIQAEYWVRELIVVKQELAAEASDSPRILFLGGSSTLFGIDSKTVEQEVGQTALNMGLHAGLRLEDILAFGSNVARSGDIVVMALEPPYYDCNKRGWSQWRVENALAWDRENFDRMPLYSRVGAVIGSGGPWLSAAVLKANIGGLLFGKMPAARKAALDPPAVIWDRYESGSERSTGFKYSAFNLDLGGNILFNDGAHFAGSGFPFKEPSRLCGDVAQQLGDFVAVMASKQVTVLFSHTPYLVDEGADDPNDWTRSEANFRESIMAIGSVVIDGRDEAMFARAQFFNTSLHLNTEGRAERTKRTIVALKHWMDQRSSDSSAALSANPP